MAQPQRRPPAAPRPQAPSQRHLYNSGVSRKQRKRARRRKQVIGIVVMLVAVAVLFVIALLITGANGAQAPSEAPSVAQPASQPAVAPPVSMAPASQAPPPVPQRASTPYDEAATPPLYNYQNPIPDTVKVGWGQAETDPDITYVNLVDIGNGQQMETRAAAAFTAMQKAAAADGVELTPVSGYRTHQQQTNNYNAAIQRYRDQGYSEAEALARTQRYYAIPGTSEHEAGLAIDINWVDDGFAQTAAYTWLQEHCTEYGFIYRYQADTEDITHIAWEPWHYRYVGANHAEAITGKGITLEEYIAEMQMG
ncbi:MAG: hypothetical protein GXY32_02975 [Ruminococcaceae bacterium]|nr:hypothetical protein [Oscillospiraceae bacterium]